MSALLDRGGARRYHASTLDQPIDLAKCSEEALLAMRICDLPVKIEGTYLAECVEALYLELAAKEISFRPRCYLADEWLTPEGEPVIGIPFYLAHPVLTRLERKMMAEAEGETKAWCMKLLRHEAGHALCYAYRLNRRPTWRRVFGHPAREYGQTYRFRPYSKNFVRHLDNHYAQYHPDEDFVETFAVWLTPRLDWCAQYQGWRALEKLVYVDKLMEEIKGREPFVKRGKPYWQAAKLRMTLRNFYRKKRRSQAEDFPDFHDPSLLRMFAARVDAADKRPLLIARLRPYKRQLLADIARWTGERKYIIREQFEMVLERARDLALVTEESDGIVLLKMATYLTALVMNYRYTGWFRGRGQKG